MSDFDPNAYLADDNDEQPNDSGFDPEAYTAEEFDPNEYVSDPDNNKDLDDDAVVPPLGPSGQDWGRAPQTGIGETIAQNATQGFTAGFSDELAGATHGLKDYLLAKAGQRGDISLGDAYRTNRDAVRRKLAATKEDRPYLANTSEVIGSVLTALLPAAPGMKATEKAAQALTKGERVARIAKGAVTGAGAGAVDAAGKSNTDLTHDSTRAGEFAQLLDDVRMGGVFGAGFGTLGAMGANSLEGLAQRARDGARNRAVDSLDPILSDQMLLNKKGLTDDLGDELLDRGIVKFGSNVKSMAPRVSNLLQESGEQIGKTRDAADDVIRKIAQDDPEAAKKLLVNFGGLQKTAARAAKRSEASNIAEQKMAKSLTKNADSFAKKPHRTIAQTQDEVAKLNKQIPFKKEFGDMTPNQQAMMKARTNLVNQMDRRIKDAVSPEQFDEYLKNKKLFGMFKEGEKILDKSVARNQRNRDLSLTDYMASQWFGSGKGPDVPLKRAAAAAAHKQLRERGNASMAVTLNTVYKLLAENPKGLGKYGQVLNTALKRGKNSFVATHMYLMSKDPEYAQLVGADEEPTK